MEVVLATRPLLRILVVDDEPGARDGLTKLLTLEGYEAVSARNAAEALDHLGKKSFDAIICDVTMPGMDGYGLTDILRHRPGTRDVPILLVSGQAQSSRQVQGLSLGADDFIAKPIDFDELLARLRARLRAAAERASLRRLSERDAVTGLLNRSAVEAQLSRELRRARRTGAGVSVFMIDVDDFKRINDTWGHAAGDASLRSLGEELLRRLRATDIVGRYGGDEFLVILPDTDRAQAEMLEARLRGIFAGSPPRPRDVPTLVRISIGTSTAAVGETDPQALVARADHAMYVDKRRLR